MMRCRYAILLSGLIVPCFFHTVAAADSPSVELDSALEPVIVTATRVQRSGYEAPTPTTVLGADDLTLRTSDTLADLLAQIPQMRNAADESTGGIDFGQSAGRGFANLRGLGTNRTLVLLDGMRLVSNDLSGDIDLLVLPSALIKRVDVVTGGASALYGSDAVAGVVNFVLDSNFTGFKATVEGGTSQEADATERKLSVAWGGDFGDRWHLIASAEYFDKDGVDADARSFATPPAIVPNPGYTPTNGQRPLMVVDNAYLADESLGGLILNGPLSGRTFLGNGSTSPYVPSSCTLSEPNVLCSSSQANLAQAVDPISLTAPQERFSGFERLAFQLSPTVEIHFDTMLAYSETSLVSYGFATDTFGIEIPINVAQNPYLPAAVRSQYLAAGISVLDLGRENLDEGTFADQFRESVENFSLGSTADLGAGWMLKAHATYGQADTGERWINAYSIDHFLDAVDAVLVNGVPTCRINAVKVTNAACAPANIFGPGNMSAAAIAFFTGDIDLPLKTNQREAAVDVTGSPLSIWAGPVSVAAGASYRQQRAHQFDSGENEDFAFTGAPPFSGEISAGEAYSQAVLPLARDLPFAKSVEVDLAARWVDYSQAGSEWPWKSGVNWIPIDGLRLRFSRSEDIRAPNIQELDLPQFAGATTTVVNPVGRGVPLFDSLGVAPGQSLIVRQIAGGNPSLKPEVAHTTSGGFVLEPPSWQGFLTSIDYFQIRIDDAITSLPAQTVVQACADGNTAQCQLITPAPANSTNPTVSTISLNSQSFFTRGVDAEMHYGFALAGGQASIRVLANYLFDYVQTVPGTPGQQLLGDLSNGLPKFQADITAKYQRGPTTAFLSGDFIGHGNYSNLLASEIENNQVPHVFYMDTTLERRWQGLCSGCSIYASISNLFNQNPPSPGFGMYTNINSSFFTGVPYDRVGRYFKLGLRVALGPASAR
jgi:iron complex outermembrane recepter protein